MASERSERDTYRGNTIENRGCLFIYWRASVASETLTGVTQSKIGDVCLFRYMYGRMYVILYFDPRVFVLVRLSTPVPNCTKQNPLVYRSVPVSP